MVSRMSSCATITLRIVRIRLSVWRAPRAVVAVEQSLQVVELVQHLLEPELVDLVDDDEEHLVVLRALGAGRCRASSSSTFRYSPYEGMTGPRIARTFAPQDRPLTRGAQERQRANGRA